MTTQLRIGQQNEGSKSCILILFLAILGLVSYLGFVRYSERTQLRERLPDVPESSSLSGLFSEALENVYSQIGFIGEVDSALWDMGMLYHANRYYAKALQVYEIIQEREPENARIAHLLADVHQSVYDFDSLKRSLERSLELGLEYGPSLVKLGRIAVKENDLEKAESLFKRAVKADPDSVLPYESLMALYSRTGEVDKKEAVESHLNRMGPAVLGQDDPLLEPIFDYCYDPSQLLVRADLSSERRDFLKADLFLDRAIAIDENDWKAFAMRMIIEFKRGDIEASIGAGLSAVDKGADVGTAMAQIANMLIENGEEERAENLLIRVIEGHPDEPQLHQTLATVQNNRGRYAMAYQSLLRAEKSLPESAEIYQLKGDLLWAMGRKDEAAIYFREAISLSPLDNISITYLIQYYIEKGRCLDAESLVDRAIALDSGNENLLALASSYFADYGSKELGRENYDKAIRLFRNASRLSPNDIQLKQKLADALFKGGESDEGWKLLNALIEAGVALPEVYLTIGEWAMREKDFATARQYFSEAVAQGENEAGYESLVAAVKTIIERMDRDMSR